MQQRRVPLLLLRSALEMCYSSAYLPLSVSILPQQGKVSPAKAIQFCSGNSCYSCSAKGMFPSKSVTILHSSKNRYNLTAPLSSGKSCYISASSCSGKTQFLQQTSFRRLIGRAESRRVTAPAWMGKSCPKQQV